MAIEFRAVEFVKQKIKEFDPKITVRRGSAIHDFLIVIMSTILEQYHNDLEDAFGDGGGLDNYETLVNDRMDALASNLLVSRISGEYGTQQARIVVDRLGDYNFGSGELYALDGDGHRWYNSNSIEITENELSSQREDSFYYFDVQFSSEEKSSGLTVISDIEDTSDFSGFVSITGSESSLTDGKDEETNEELYLRLKNAVAVRDLVPKKGIISILNEQFGGSFVDINPVGFGEPEMMRDIRYDNDGNKINLHLGGYTDVYLKSNKLTQKTIDFLGVPIDTTREYEKEYIVQLDQSNPVFIGFAPLISVDYVKNLSGTILDPTSFTIDLSAGTISSNNNLSIAVRVGVTYNPITIDIKRIPRDGRDDFTISDLVFIKVISIEELDPSSGEPNGTVLERNGGFGQGGFGLGPFGIGQYGDWKLIIEKPSERFSMLEDSYIDLSHQHLGKDLRINYYCVPEWGDIHDFCRDSSERVTTADVLPKNFIPVFVNGELDVEVAMSNSNAPDIDAITDAVEDFIKEYGSNQNLSLELVIGRLFDIGVARVDKSFSWIGEIHHCNGVVELIRSDKALEIPNPTLPKDTDMPISVNIARFYPGEITVNRSTRTDL